MASKLADLRRSLVETRTKLREAQAALPVARARAERRAIEAAGGDEKALGSNESARNRALTIALADDAEYQAALALVRGLESGIDGIERDIEIARDERREREWTIRERLIAALDGRGIAVEEPTNDNGGAFDDVATESVTQQTIDQVSETDAETTTDDTDLFDDDIFASFDDAESAGEGAEGETEPPVQEPAADGLPELDPTTDPIARMVSGLKPTPDQRKPADIKSFRQNTRYCEYEAQIAKCQSITDVVKLSFDIVSDPDIDNDMQLALREVYEQRKAELEVEVMAATHVSEAGSCPNPVPAADGLAKTG